MRGLRILDLANITLFLKINIGKIPECVLIPIKGFICCRNLLLGPPDHPFYFCKISIYVLRRVGMGTIPELSLRKVGILTLPGKVRIPTWHGSIPELSLRKVGIGTK